jgi:hypothetical protein
MTSYCFNKEVISDISRRKSRNPTQVCRSRTAGRSYETALPSRRTKCLNKAVYLQYHIPSPSSQQRPGRRDIYREFTFLRGAFADQTKTAYAHSLLLPPAPCSLLYECHRKTVNFMVRTIEIRNTIKCAVQWRKRKPW